MPNRFNFSVFFTRGLLLSLLAWASASAALAGQSYSHYFQGDLTYSPKAPYSPPVPKSNTQSVVLMGGGYDVAEAFRWMIRQSGVQPANCSSGACTPTTGGRFLILRASGTDAYNPYLLSRLGTVDSTTPMRYENVGGVDMGLTSVETLVVPSVTAANDPFVVSRIQAAQAIWIAGGNQADYVNFWQGTQLKTYLNKAIQKGVPVGGTSAGNAILGQYVFAALKGTVTSSQAIVDPFNKYMTFDPVLPNSSPSLLNIASLANTITDDHLETRDRMGRMVAFLSRITQQICGGPADIGKSRAIGLDEETAMVVSYSGPTKNSQATATAQLVSNPVYQKTQNIPNPNSVYLLEFTPQNISSYCSAGKPLQITSSPAGAFALVRMTASPASATTTAFSTSPKLISLSSNQNVSYVDGSNTFNLMNWSLSNPCSTAVPNGSLCNVATDLSVSNSYLYGTAY